MEGADRKTMWAQRQRWAAQLLKEAERKGASGLLQLRLFLAGEVGQHGWAVDAVCGEGEDAEQFVCMMAELAGRETTPAVRTAGLYEVQLAQFWLARPGSCASGRTSASCRSGSAGWRSTGRRSASRRS